MLGVPMIQRGADLPAQAGAGDLIPVNARVGSLTTVGAGTWTAALIAGGAIRRTGPVGGYTDTTDTAENIRLALGAGVPNGSSFMFTFINGVAQALTWAGGTGVTSTGTVTVAASVIRQYIVTMVNNTPQQTYLATTATSTVLTAMTRAQTDSLTVGMFVSGTNIAANSFIVSIQPGVGVTLSQATTGNGSNLAITFSPVVNFEGIGVMTA